MISLTTKSRTGKIILAFFSVLIALAVAEGILRFKGYQPGFKAYTSNFKQVDSLFILDGYYTDSNGLMRVSQSARQFICRELKTNKSWRKLKKRTSHQALEVYSLARDFMQLRDPNYSSVLKSFIESSDQSPGNEEKEVNEAIKNYAGCPINSDGFKSIEFRKYDTKRKSILLLGDSFTWGNSAKNKSSCFADLLLALGYVVYNTGIVAADPSQYLQAAKVFIPKLKPDFVVINFYMGNDIFYFERKPQAFKPLFYCTNAGYLLSYRDGIYFDDAKEAYEKSLELYAIPDDGILLNKLCKKTVITTLLWNALAKRNLLNSGLAEHKKRHHNAEIQYYSTPYSNAQVKEIREISEQYGGTFILVVIPSLKEGKLSMPQDVPGLFDGMEYFVPPVKPMHYVKRVDGHYNEQGHAIQAAFIDSLIQHDLNVRNF